MNTMEMENMAMALAHIGEQSEKLVETMDQIIEIYDRGGTCTVEIAGYTFMSLMSAQQVLLKLAIEKGLVTEENLKELFTAAHERSSAPLH